MVPSPLRLELFEDVAVGEIQVDRRRRQAIVAEDLLHGRQGDPLLEGQRRPGMAEHVRGDLPGELGAVGDPLDDLLGLTRPDEPSRRSGRNRVPGWRGPVRTAGRPVACSACREGPPCR